MKDYKDKFNFLYTLKFIKFISAVILIKYLMILV